MKYLSLFFLMSYALCSFGQTPVNTEEVVRRVADNIIKNTSFQFVNTKTNQKYASTKGLEPSGDIHADSRYNKWAYVNGVLTTGMMQMANVIAL